MSVLILLFRRSKGAILASVLAAVVSGAVTTVLVAMLNAAARRGPGLSFSSLPLFVALCLTRLLAGAMAHVMLVRLSQYAMRDLRVDLATNVLEAPLAGLEAIGPAKLLAIFGDDMFHVASVVVNLPYAFVNVIILMACFVYFGWLSPPLLGGALLCLVLGIITYLLPVIWANRRLAEARRVQDTLHGHFRALTDGTKELQMRQNHAQHFLQRQLLPTAHALSRANIIGITAYSLAANWNRTLFFAYAGALVFLPGAMRAAGATPIAAYLLVVLYMMAPLEAIMNVLPLVAQADVALQKIFSLGISLKKARVESDEGSQFDSARRSAALELKGVTYGYGQDGYRPFVLGPVDLVFEPGQITFITGGNGTGKTTLAKIIAGLYFPNEGSVSFDGVQVTNENRKGFRKLIGAVFSDAFPFQSVFTESPDHEARINKLLHRLQLHRKTRIENGQFTTIQLSQGQRKRLALLMAIVEECPIYLFDEWAADQDPDFKQIFYLEILPELKERGAAIVVISHDDAYYHVADHLFKLEEGQLVKQVTAVNQAVMS